MAGAHTHSDTTAAILLRAEAAAPRRPEGAEVLEDWLASLGGLFRAAGDFEPDARAGA